MKTFEIYDATEKLTVADRLTFEDMAEMMGIYQELFPNNEFIACYRIERTTVKISASAFQSFRKEWLVFIEEIQDNI